MKPRLVSCYFDAGDGSTQWPRLARVLRYTAERHCPEWEIDIRAIRPDPMRSALGILSHVCNTQKMQAWYDAVHAAPDGARLLLMDTDAFVVNPLDDVWDQDFDFAHTTKPSRFPFNSGVVFVRVSERTRAFFRVWRDENVRMLSDRIHHQEWRRQYGGINQAALGYALAHGLTKTMHMVDLPCWQWNCEDSSWSRFDSQQTRIVHAKSALRMHIFRISAPASPFIRTLSRMWHDAEKEAMSAEAARDRDAVCQAE